MFSAVADGLLGQEEEVELGLDAADALTLLLSEKEDFCSCCQAKESFLDKVIGQKKKKSLSKSSSSSEVSKVRQTFLSPVQRARVLAGKMRARRERRLKFRPCAPKVTSMMSLIQSFHLNLQLERKSYFPTLLDPPGMPAEVSERILLSSSCSIALEDVKGMSECAVMVTESKVMMMTEDKIVLKTISLEEIFLVELIANLTCALRCASCSSIWLSFKGREALDCFIACLELAKRALERDFRPFIRRTSLADHSGREPLLALALEEAKVNRTDGEGVALKAELMFTELDDVLEGDSGVNVCWKHGAFLLK